MVLVNMERLDRRNKVKKVVERAEREIKKLENEKIFRINTFGHSKTDDLIKFAEEMIENGCIIKEDGVTVPKRYNSGV